MYHIHVAYMYLGDKAVDDLVWIVKYEMSIERIQVVTTRVLSLSCHEVMTTEHVHTLLLKLRGVDYYTHKINNVTGTDYTCTCMYVCMYNSASTCICEHHTSS